MGAGGHASNVSQFGGPFGICTPGLASETQLHPQVYQTISAYTSRLDNVVELYSKLPVPSLPGFSRSEPVITTATLRHAFEPIGGSTSQITFEDTEIKTTGLPLWPARMLCTNAGMPGEALCGARSVHPYLESAVCSCCLRHCFEMVLCSALWSTVW